MAHPTQDRWAANRTNSDFSTGRSVLHDSLSSVPQDQASTQYLSHLPSNPRVPQAREALPRLEIPFYPPHRQHPRYPDTVHGIQPAVPLIGCQSLVSRGYTGEQYHGAAFNSKEKDRSLDEAQKWWVTDPRTPQMQQIMSLPSPLSALTQTAREQDVRRTTTQLFAPLIINLQSYLHPPSTYNCSHFSYWGAVPEWCIDTSGGTNSFFGEDWGAPPPRVGRDPRFRPLNGFGSPYEDRRAMSTKTRGYWIA
ncbi:MAG: hypothetical protein M1814_005634 [Vezdaea aestivalis]|nr:MAG: hypothetical protein M1814_005634 [Vezdaea aestivalis]